MPAKAKSNFLELMRIGVAKSIQENTIDPIKKAVEDLETDSYGLISKEEVLKIIEDYSLINEE